MNLDMEFFQSMIFWAIINFIILFLVFKYLFFKKITVFMENRSNMIQEQLDFASKSKEEAIELKEQSQKILDDSYNKANEIIEKATQEAQKQANYIIQQAKLEAQKIIDTTMKELEVEKKKQINELKNQFVSIALSAASKVIEKNLSTEENRKMVEDIFDEAGVA